MKLGHVVRTLAAGATFYVVMAACAAVERNQGAEPISFEESGASSGSSGQTSSGSSTSSSSGVTSSSSTSGTIVDALTDPVSEAKADVLPPEISTDPCDKTHGAFVYAEHAYPGISANELALVVAVVPTTSGPAGYTKQPTGLSWVRDGAVAVNCGAASSPTFTTVTFVRHR